MSTTTIVRATSPADLLAAIPGLLGHHPAESLVVVPLRGSRTVGALRADLPTAADADQLAETLTGMIARVPGITAIIPVVYTAADPGRHARTVNALTGLTSRAGISTIHTVFVTDDGWGDYTTPDEIHPAAWIDASPVTEQVGPQPTQAEAIDLPARDEDTAAAILDALRNLTGTDLDALSVIEQAVTTPEPTPLLQAAILTLIQRPWLRDTALIQWARDADAGQAVYAAQDAYRHGKPMPVNDLTLTLAGDGPRPDTARLEAARTLLRTLAVNAPTGTDAAALAASAWISWALGRTTEAHRAAEAAAAADPALSFAALILTMTTSGHLPAWAFNRA